MAVSKDGRYIASGGQNGEGETCCADFLWDAKTGKLIQNKDGTVVLLGESDAKALLAEVQKGQWKIAEIDEKPVTRKPAPPFITSTLQQEAAKKLGFGPQLCERARRPGEQRALLREHRIARRRELRLVQRSAGVSQLLEVALARLLDLNPEELVSTVTRFNNAVVTGTYDATALDEKTRPLLLGSIRDDQGLTADNAQSRLGLVGQALGLPELVGGEQHTPALVPLGGDQVPDHQAALGIDASGRLVE